MSNLFFSVEMCGSPCQVSNGPTFVSATFGLSATPAGYVEKLFLKQFQVDFDQLISNSANHAPEPFDDKSIGVSETRDI